MAPLLKRYTGTIEANEVRHGVISNADVSNDSTVTLNEVLENSDRTAVAQLRCHLEDITRILSAFDSDIPEGRHSNSPRIDSLTTFGYQTHPYCEVIANLIR